MERGQLSKKDMKVEIPSETDNMASGGTKCQGAGATVLTRQPSAPKSNCLCSPTSHAGSFRCRLHRAPSLQRTKSIDSVNVRDSSIKVNETTANNSTGNANIVEAQ